MDQQESAAANLARNVAEIRTKKAWSQAELARLAGIPRSTLTNVESGSGNPSLSNLVKLSTALQVGLEELLSRPRTACKLIPADEVPVLSRNRGRVRIHKLLPERIKGLEIDKMAFEPASSMGGTPHVPGTKEYLHCLEGELNVLVAGQVFPVAAGGVLAFPGDQPHSYRNRGQVPALAVSIVVPVPVASGRD